MEDPKKTAARDFAKSHAKWGDWQGILESRPPETICNLMIVLIQQTKFLLDRMIVRQEEDFKKLGGVRERMHAARTATRAEIWDKEMYSRLAAAKDPAELASRVNEIKDHVDRAAWNIRRRKGW